RIQTDRLLEQMSQADGKHAGAAADIQEPAVPIQTRLLRQDGFEFRRVRGATIAIVSSRAEVDGRVVWHRTSIARSVTTAIVERTRQPPLRQLRPSGPARGIVTFRSAPPSDETRITSRRRRCSWSSHALCG